MTKHTARVDVELYRPRAAWAMGVQELQDWRLKLYGITYNAEAPDRHVTKAALAAAHGRLPQPATTPTRYGVGFLGVHEGRTANFIFLDWWGQEDELFHHVWYSAIEDPVSLRPARLGEPIACVWDLRVLWHERDAWVRHVLANPAGPDFDAYLMDQLSGHI